MTPTLPASPAGRHGEAAAWGAAIGVLGGLIGLGGAEFRLPLLLGVFALAPLLALRVNLAVSLATVLSSLLFRAGPQGLAGLAAHAYEIGVLLAGSLAGAWAGAGLAQRIAERVLRRLMAGLLFGLALLIAAHDSLPLHGAALSGPLAAIAGVAAGLGIGLVSSLLGVAGGELLIPTFMLLFAAPVTLAGTLSLAVSGPTIALGVWRHLRTDPQTLRGCGAFVAAMAAGSVAGAFGGAALVGAASPLLLQLMLGAILAVSALKEARRAWRPAAARP